jgi:hypothetical protein
MSVSSPFTDGHYADDGAAAMCGRTLVRLLAARGRRGWGGGRYLRHLLVDPLIGLGFPLRSLISGQLP